MSLEKQFIIEQELRDIYCNPSTGYQSMERLSKSKGVWIES